ncbi:uncharacterized protein LOC133195186 [Saccostrea echinata]|uniref:uncharacterized protein LOC133195186 n=1 Tax=Saccostrea echinata TaxID=191078 RepID=UPI002A825659|nr:uncharacterized protein LOC133195186 [Saccostrea echinata]
MRGVQKSRRWKAEHPIIKGPRLDPSERTLALPLENQMRELEVEARERRNRMSSTENSIIRQPTRETPIIYRSGHTVNLPNMNQNRERIVESRERRERCRSRETPILGEPRDYSSGHTFSLPLENHLEEGEPDSITDQQPIYTIYTEVIEEQPTNHNNGGGGEFLHDENRMRELSASSPPPPSYAQLIRLLVSAWMFCGLRKLLI